MAFMEMDSCFLRAIRYLHSVSHESQNNLRLMLDEAIKNKYGPGKELGSFIFSPAFQDFPVITSSNNIAAPDTAVQQDESKVCSNSETDLELDFLKEDLTCVVCKGMGVGARNRLNECIDCHNLYHQECHEPTITDEEIDSSDPWTCASCKDAQASKAKKPAPAPVSSVPVQKPTPVPVTSKVYSEKDYSEAPAAKLQASMKASVASSIKQAAANHTRVLTPNINIISADKRIQIMKKKAAKLQEKRKLSR